MTVNKSTETNKYCMTETKDRGQSIDIWRLFWIDNRCCFAPTYENRICIIFTVPWKLLICYASVKESYRIAAFYSYLSRYQNAPVKVNNSSLQSYSTGLFCTLTLHSFSIFLLYTFTLQYYSKVLLYSLFQQSFSTTLRDILTLQAYAFFSVDLKNICFFIL